MPKTKTLPGMPSPRDWCFEWLDRNAGTAPWSVAHLLDNLIKEVPLALVPSFVRCGATPWVRAWVRAQGTVSVDQGGKPVHQLIVSMKLPGIIEYLQATALRSLNDALAARRKVEEWLQAQSELGMTVEDVYDLAGVELPAA